MAKTQSAIHNPRSATAWIALGVLTVFVYFFGLTIPLVGPDESRYAQVAREMFERGDWITPTLGGYNWFEKPALLYWLQIAAYYLFGINEFAARFGSALFGLGTVTSLYVLGRSISKSQISNLKFQISNIKLEIADANFARYLALIAASTFGILVFSRGASFDIIITFPLTAALVSFFIFDQREYESGKSKLIPLVLFYVFIGVALLAKGLIGIVFPFAIVAFYLLLSRKLPSRTFFVSLFWGTAIAVLIACLWYLPMYLRHGYGFIDEFFIQHHFQRFTSNKYQHPQPFIFFFWILPLMTLPWLPFFIAGIVSFARRLFHCRNAKTQIKKGPKASGENLPFSSSPLLLFSTAWILVPLVFFSLSGSKLPGYILPSVPPAIVLTAAYVVSLTAGSRTWAAIVKLTVAAVLVATIIGLLTVVPKFAATDSVKGLIEAANDRGYANEPVLGLHTISHNAEFYAGGRLF